jgi:hypothetical protein
MRLYETFVVETLSLNEWRTNQSLSKAKIKPVPAGIEMGVLQKTNDTRYHFRQGRDKQNLEKGTALSSEKSENFIISTRRFTQNIIQN